MTEKEVLEKLNFFKESIFSLKKEIAEDEELIVGLTNSNEGFQEEIKKLKEEVEYWKEKAMENPEEINELENYKESSQKMFDEYTKSIQEIERLKKKLSIKEATENKDVKIVMKPAEIELEEMLKKIEKEGFKNIPTEKRVKMLEEQRKQIEESEERFKTDRKQLERQFTL